MAAKTTCLLLLYGYAIVGMVIVGLNAAAAHSNDSSPTPMYPLTGYGHFNVSGKNGKICILLDLSCSITAQLQVNNTVSPVTYDLPLNADSSGNCTEEASSVTLSWKMISSNLTGFTNLTLSMAFKKMEEKWKTTSLAFTAKMFVNETESGAISAVQNDSSNLIITANKEKSFKCSESQDIALNGNVQVTVTLNKIQVQPFGSDFGEADVCFSSSSGDKAEPVDTIVPTAVGCVLAGLIVILIITYFVGRCKRPGYQKM